MPDTMKLPCVLAEHEVANRAMRMARLVDEIEKLDAKKKLVDGDIKRERDHADEEVRILAKQVRERAEVLDVEVEYKHDDARFAVDTIRTDTGEIVASRPMTDDERKEAMQADLPGIGRKRRRGRGEPNSN